MTKTKTVYKHNEGAAKHTKLATFTLGENDIQATWHDQGYQANVTTFGLFMPGKGPVFLSDLEFWDALDLAYANSSMIWVESE